MTEKETFDYCTESFRNFLLSFYEKFTDSPDEKFLFEYVLAFTMKAESEEQPEISQFSLYLCKSIVHFGDKLIAELRKIFEEVIPSERRMEWS